MVPLLALAFGFAFVWWLFRMDMSWRELPSRALWIPGLWLAQSSSRSIGFWLGSIGIGGGGSSNLEGNNINSLFNGTLFLLALIVLKRRGFSWGQFVAANKALVTVFVFFLFSMLWSEFPFPTLKRLVQEFGAVLIAPILLTEKNSPVSFRILFARVSYILFPLSVVLIRYFPKVGRNISSVSGAQMVSGVADHKNSLGQLALVFLLVLLWDFAESRKDGTAPKAGAARSARFINFGIGIYLLLVSSSATSLMCFLFGLGLYYASERLSQLRNAKMLFIASVFLIVGAMIVNQKFGISSRVSMALGRGENMSGRKAIWDKILEKETNPLVGHGFRGFWETPEGLSVAEELQTNRLVSSHNGYLEIYVQGGLVGLFLLFVFLLATGINATDKLVVGDPLGRIAILVWPILLIYNATESAYLQVGTLWFTMLIVTMRVPWQNVFAREESSDGEDLVSESVQTSVASAALHYGQS
jgi:exopolysaccharide production protein ExoQ